MLLVALLAGMCGLGHAQPNRAGQGGWELRACADPANFPFSDREGRGFENHVAALLADELGARLTYAWLPLPRRDTDQELMLRMGACDVLLGVPDGQEPFLTTLAYYRSSAMFVRRADAPFDVASLDDPVLADLTIGVQRGSPEDYALVGRGYIENVRHYFVSDPRDVILQHVADGTLDLGIVWGPIAGYYRRALDLPLTLTPVTPEIDTPFLPMVQAIALGVRGTDEGFRDLLNHAIAARWQEIQATLEGFGVPLLALPPPTLPTSDAAGAGPGPRVEVGVVLPTLTGTDPVFPLGDELAGEPARLGAVLAEEVLGEGADPPLRVWVASAPTPEAARRAARRLIAAQGVSALVGGVGAGQAQELSAVAEEASLPFLNVGDADDGLRAACRPATFHVAASEGMLLDALAAALQQAGHTSWFVVRADVPTGERRDERLAESLARRIPEGRELGRALVATDQPLYLDVIEAIAGSGADAVVLLLEADAQLVFLGQYETAAVAAEAFGYAATLTQTRQFYAALAHDAPTTGSGPRVALWDSSLGSPAATELGERFLARWGQPMDPSAWAAYAAVKIVVDAVAAVGSAEPRELIDYLGKGGQGFDVLKGAAVSFGAADHQLRQPLYVVTLDPHAATPADIATVALEVREAGAPGQPDPARAPGGPCTP